MGQKGNVFLIILLAVAAIAASGAIGFWWKQRQAVVPTLIPTPVEQKKNSQPSDEMANWKTYANSSLGISFQYPQENTVFIGKGDNWQQFGQFMLSISTPQNTNYMDFYTDKLKSQAANFNGLKTLKSLQLVNGYWDILSLDASYPASGGPFIAYQVVKNNIRYVFVFLGTTSTNDNFSQLVSTFKFL